MCVCVFVCVCVCVFETLKMLGVFFTSGQLWLPMQSPVTLWGGRIITTGGSENLDSPLVSFGATLAGQGRNASFLLLGLKVQNHPRVPLIPWDGMCRGSLKANKGETLAPYLIFSDTTLVEISVPYYSLSRVAIQASHSVFACVGRSVVSVFLWCLVGVEWVSVFVGLPLSSSFG